MQITTVLTIRREDSSTLLPIMQRFNNACNWLSQTAFNENLFHWLPLQRRAYRELRDRFWLSSAEAVVAVRKVAAVYKSKARRAALAKFRPFGSIPLYNHAYKRDGAVRLYRQMVQCKARPGVILSSKHQATLVYRQGCFFIHQVIDVPTPSLYAPKNFLGCDLGIVNILADSDGAVYSGGHLNGLRKRHAKLRGRLQQKGTRSAKRLLRKRRHREKRFARWVNHNIAKKVVAKAKDTFRGIALEELGGIHERITVKKAQRRQHYAWAFNQLRFFIEYKAALSGTPVVLVDPRNSSRTCPICGLVDKHNRPSQAVFSCVGCSFVGNADTVAATIIGRRAASDQPHATPCGSCESQDGMRVVKG